jgi:hypothetical protein
MPVRVRQPYDEPVIVPALDDRVVNPHQVVDIPNVHLPNFLAAGWRPADADTKKSAEGLTAAADKAQSSGGSASDEAAPAAGQEG